MKILPALLLIVAATSTVYSQSTPDSPCFSISNSGRPPRTGEIYKFTLAGPTDFDWTSVKLKWTINPQLELTGANTREVSFKWDRPDKHGTITASVEIDGTLGNCAKLLTETMSWDGPADPVKVGVWKVKQDESPFKQFAADMANHPDNQGLIYIVRSTDSTLDTLNKIKTTALSYLTQDSARLTILEGEGPEEIAEIWRVPPGADNPKCDSCKVAQCPAITVTGPGGIWLPGESIAFVASVENSEPKNLTFDRTVDVGNIIEGQGSSVIKVRTLEDPYNQRITATVKVSGMPLGCTSTASEVAWVVIEPTYVRLDEHSTSPIEIRKSSLDKLAKHLAAFPDHYGYIIEYFPPKTSKAVIQRKIGLIKSYMRSRGQADNEYRIVTAEANKLFTKVFAVPPGVENPQP